MQNQITKEKLKKYFKTTETALKKAKDSIIRGKESRLEILIWKNQRQLPARRWLTTFRHEDLILKNTCKAFHTYDMSVAEPTYLCC